MFWGIDRQPYLAFFDSATVIFMSPSGVVMVIALPALRVIVRGMIRSLETVRHRERFYGGCRPCRR